MGTPNPQEIWQVEVGGQVYEAPFGELGDWIGEGSLLPEDKVRKGNLRWIEARRVPSLIPFFNAKEKGMQIPVVMHTTDASLQEAGVDVEVLELPPVTQTYQAAATDPIEHSIAVPAQTQNLPHDPDFCSVHSDVPSVFLCDGCANGFCKVCPKAYGGSVRICP